MLNPEEFIDYTPKGELVTQNQNRELANVQNFTPPKTPDIIHNFYLKYIHYPKFGVVCFVLFQLFLLSALGVILSAKNNAEIKQLQQTQEQINQIPPQ